MLLIASYIIANLKISSKQLQLICPHLHLATYLSRLYKNNSGRGVSLLLVAGGLLNLIMVVIELNQIRYCALSH